MSHFSQKCRDERDRSPFKDQKLPTHPDKHASGTVKGQKIAIRAVPIKHNILEELNLRDHFLQKLHELRAMKEEYNRL